MNKIKELIRKIDEELFWHYESKYEYYSLLGYIFLIINFIFVFIFPCVYIFIPVQIISGIFIYRNEMKEIE